MDKKKLEKFLYKARVKTNAKAGGQVKPLLPGTEQSEYSEGDWLYRDVYYNGKNSFSGIDAVLYKGKPVWSSCYYGSYEGLNESELDEILRNAIKDHPETCGYKHVQAEYGDYIYDCTPDSFSKSISEIGGYESIAEDGDEVYHFYYAGSLL